MRRFVGRWLGLSALAAAFLVPRGPATDAQEIDEDAAFESFVRRRIPGMTREERERRARTNGALRVRGRVRASGKLFATSVHVEKGAEIDASEGFVLYSLGPIVVDGKIQGGPRFEARKDAPGSVGAKGADGADITMISAEDITVNDVLVGNAGADGAGVEVIQGPKGKGGDGGRGGDVTIRVSKKGGTITVNGAIFPGRGGTGGDALVRGIDASLARPGGPATATGGKSGDAGKVLIQATNVVFGAGGKIEFQAAIRGGTASAFGGAGGVNLECFDAVGGRGGDARATGGKCGKGGDVVVQATSLEPAGVGANAFVQSASFLGIGGAAYARGGAGGRGGDCSDAEGCPSRGRRGSKGGDGGRAIARGGDGNFGTRILGSAFAGRAVASVEQDPTGGGFASAVGGDGASGSPGQTAEFPGAGGAGGRAGAATATGGRGGNCRVGLGPTGAPDRGGTGGDAVAGSEDPRTLPGAGGVGGDCCENPGGAGGPGGKAGVVETQTATAGKGGACGKSGEFGAEGTKTVHAAGTAADGASGASCPGLAYELTVSPNPTTHNQATTFGVTITNTDPSPIQVTVQLYHLRAGKPPYLISEQTVVVPGAVGGTPGTITVTGFGSPPNVGNNQGFQVKVGGKEVGRTTFDVK